MLRFCVVCPFVSMSIYQNELAYHIYIRVILWVVSSQLRGDVDDAYYYFIVCCLLFIVVCCCFTLLPSNNNKSISCNISYVNCIANVSTNVQHLCFTPTFQLHNHLQTFINNIFSLSLHLAFD